MPQISFLPGPVAIAPAVRSALQRESLSHRGQAFQHLVDRVTSRLKQMTNAPQVTIQSGSGTLANDMVAAQLSIRAERGLILDNGEFGGRLVDHARRFGLDHDVHRISWGAAFDLVDIADIFAHQHPAWVWATHCETSTGVLNDLDGLRSVAREHDVLLCMDCISSLGTVPVNLDGVHLASGTSGKGLGSYPGLALVFADHPVVPNARLPRSLDLGFHLEHGGIPFTLPSNLLAALECALCMYDTRTRLPEIVARGVTLRKRFTMLGYRILAEEAVASPAVVTVTLPPDRPSTLLGAWLAEAGFLVSYESGYLMERNWFQICLMGDTGDVQIDALLDALSRFAP